MYDIFTMKRRTQRLLAETGGLVKENVVAVEATNLLTLFVFSVSFSGKNRRTMADPQKQKLRLDYPCSWTYKIIGRNPDDMQSAVHEVVRDRSCRVSLSRQSATAKYVCLHIELTVESESHRLDLYEKLKTHPAIDVIL
ncbi:MAG TPA: DUF493 domain-containing protein [Smithellaceae bacterium]|nr:DUF493 domain-containing protein [Syntrophaceae bacterium]HOE22632.1 DUF493 domain-containing protein [Smithellaceae bacterium]MBP8666653.1 DUF493 domain-containing protein [Syntrophaceae bacterium]MBP9532691.1 DUF493 domain-containing protein [Syntrophaceae bacterium]HOU56423.1 DUF493 domain-containing protein [Smithellaceae bacterium]